MRAWHAQHTLLDKRNEDAYKAAFAESTLVDM